MSNPIICPHGAEDSDGCEIEFRLVTDAVLTSFARGELDACEAEAMEAFLDDHPDLRRVVERLRPAPAPCTPA